MNNPALSGSAEVPNIPEERARILRAGGRVSEETFGGVSAFRVYQSGSPVSTREPRALEMLANVLGLKFSAVSTSTF